MVLSNYKFSNGEKYRKKNKVLIQKIKHGRQRGKNNNNIAISKLEKNNYFAFWRHQYCLRQLQIDLHQITL